MEKVLLSSRAQMNHLVNGKETVCGLAIDYEKSLKKPTDLEQFQSYKFHCKKCLKESK